MNLIDTLTAMEVAYDEIEARESVTHEVLLCQYHGKADLHYQSCLESLQQCMRKGNQRQFPNSYAVF